jgi:hypothetical protein
MVSTAKIMQLKIPFSLAKYAVSERKLVNKYEVNHFVKNITTFIILKAESQYSIIKDFTNQIDHLSRQCQCERQTFKKRLNWMVKQKLATVEGSTIRLITWQQVARLYYLNLDGFNIINYDSNTNKNIHLRLFATEIEMNQKSQAYMVEKKMQQNPALSSEIKSTMLRHGVDLKQVHNKSFVMNWMKGQYRYSFKVEPALHKLLNKVRPDCNRGVKGIAYEWNCKSPQTVSYVKKKMVAACIVHVKKGERITSSERVRNADCHVIWNKRKKQTVLALVDEINVLPSLQNPSLN